MKELTDLTLLSLPKGLETEQVVYKHRDGWRINYTTSGKVLESFTVGSEEWQIIEFEKSTWFSQSGKTLFDLPYQLWHVATTELPTSGTHKQGLVECIKAWSKPVAEREGNKVVTDISYKVTVKPMTDEEFKKANDNLITSFKASMKTVEERNREERAQAAKNLAAAAKEAIEERNKRNKVGGDYTPTVEVDKGNKPSRVILGLHDKLSDKAAAEIKEAIDSLNVTQDDIDKGRKWTGLDLAKKYDPYADMEGVTVEKIKLDLPVKPLSKDWQVKGEVPKRGKRRDQFEGQEIRRTSYQNLGRDYGHELNVTFTEGYKADGDKRWWWVEVENDPRVVDNLIPFRKNFYMSEDALEAVVQLEDHLKKHNNDFARDVAKSIRWANLNIYALAKEEGVTLDVEGLMHPVFATDWSIKAVRVDLLLSTRHRASSTPKRYALMAEGQGSMEQLRAVMRKLKSSKSTKEEE